MTTESPRKRHTILKVIAGFLIGFVVVILIVIAATSGGSDATVTLPAKAAATSSQPASHAPNGSASHPLPFGGTWTADGTTVALSAPKAYSPSASAFIDTKMPRYVEFTVTLTNHSDHAINADGSFTDQLTANDVPGSVVYDDNVGMPIADILPGHAATWHEVYGIPAAGSDLIWQFSPLFGGQTVYFEGAVK